jgi:hypothetical protein
MKLPEQHSTVVYLSYFIYGINVTVVGLDLTDAPPTIYSQDPTPLLVSIYCWLQ